MKESWQCEFLLTCIYHTFAKGNVKFPVLGYSYLCSCIYCQKHFVCESPVRLAESWLKLAENIVLAELLWEKNTVPAEKTSRIWGKPNGAGCRNLNNINNLVQEPHLEESRPMRPRDKSGVKHKKKSLVLIDFILSQLTLLSFPNTMTC